MLLNWQTHEIIATAFGKGRTHDFKLFKQSCTHVHPRTMVLADLGYLGLEKLHSVNGTSRSPSGLDRAYSSLPVKATKHLSR